MVTPVLLLASMKHIPIICIVKGIADKMRQHQLLLWLWATNKRNVIACKRYIKVACTQARTYLVQEWNHVQCISMGIGCVHKTLQLEVQQLLKQTCTLVSISSMYSSIYVIYVLQYLYHIYIIYVLQYLYHICSYLLVFGPDLLVMGVVD